MPGIQCAGYHHFRRVGFKHDREALQTKRASDLQVHYTQIEDKILNDIESDPQQLLDLIKTCLKAVLPKDRIKTMFVEELKDEMVRPLMDHYQVPEDKHTMIESHVMRQVLDKPAAPYSFETLYSRAYSAFVAELKSRPSRKEILAQALAAQQNRQSQFSPAANELASGTPKTHPKVHFSCMVKVVEYEVPRRIFN